MMALATAGTVSRIAPFIGSVKFVAFNGKSLLCPQTKAFVVPSATIVSKQFLQEKRPKPWPFREKGYNMFHYYFCDKTQWRFNENTKVIVVDGNIASGKTTLAKKLAEDLDMQYYCEPTADMWYTNEYGFNKRELNKKLPKNAWFFNKEDFYRDPNKVTATRSTFKAAQMSLMHYVDALSHVLNTGQGVVMDRSFYSNMAFIEALIETDLIRKEFRQYYKDVHFILKKTLLRPHLIIYLDVPVEALQERIKKRGIDYELNTTVLSKKYLSSIEKNYKNIVLPEISKHSELLVYDWSNFGDAEVVVEDIELIDFDKYTIYDEKLDDWRVDRERQWGSMRMILTNERAALHNWWLQPHAHIPEMFLSYEDHDAQRRAILEHPTERYADGYNAEAGDKNIWFKTKDYGDRFRGARTD